MLKIILFLLVIFSYQVKAVSDFKLAEDESIFDESDLVDIESGAESGNEDALLEKEFDDINQDESEDNFDIKDFEEIAEDSDEDQRNQDESLGRREDFDPQDYEILSDRPGYEVLTDQELEKIFDDDVSNLKEIEDESLEEEDFDESLEEEDLNDGLEGEDLNDGLEGEDLNDGLEGEDLNDGLEGEDLNDGLEGEDLNDGLEGEDLNDGLEGEDLNDGLEGEDLNDGLEGEDLNDGLEGEDLNDDLEGEDLNDDLEGEDLNDDLEGEDLNDDLEGEDLNDGLEGEDLNDGLEGEDLNDGLEGEDLNDDLEGEDLNDGLEGEDLNDGLEEEPIEEQPIQEESDFSLEDSFLEENTDQELSLNLITNIRYLVESDQIVIDSSDALSYEERVNQENNQLIIEILQSRLAENLSWPYILRDFDTDFGLIKADQKDSTTVRVIIQLKPEAPIPSVDLTDKGIIIGESRLKLQEEDLSRSEKLLPSKSLKDLYFGNIDFVGDPISFHVIDADIKQVLRFISEESGLNMVIDEAVQGTITLKLEDIPWDQALYTIFKVKSLGYTRDGSVITVLPLSKIEEQTITLKKISDRQKGLSPIQTKLIPIMFVKAQDIEATVKQFSTPPVQGLFEGGKIIIHEESNSLIVMDNQEAIQKIQKMVSFLDRPSQQVMIESKIVEVSKNFARNFGLNWNLSGDLPVRIASNGLLDFLQTTFNGLSGSWSIQENGRTSAFNLAGLPFIGDISATLNLAENNGTARVLNTSKILVQSGQPASVDKNTPILIRTTETQRAEESIQDEGIVTSTFTQQDIRFNSSVTPTVTSSGSIAMDVNVTLSDPGPGGEGGVTLITRNAATKIIAGNGQTVVLSGIYQKSENKSESGIPILKDIPILSSLFGDSSFSTAESEMLMFITPTLVEN